MVADLGSLEITSQFLKSRIVKTLCRQMSHIRDINNTFVLQINNKIKLYIYTFGSLLVLGVAHKLNKTVVHKTRKCVSLGHIQSLEVDASSIRHLWLRRRRRLIPTRSGLRTHFRPAPLSDGNRSFSILVVRQEM